MLRAGQHPGNPRRTLLIHTSHHTTKHVCVSGRDTPRRVGRSVCTSPHTQSGGAVPGRPGPWSFRRWDSWADACPAPLRPAPPRSAPPRTARGPAGTAWSYILPSGHPAPLLPTGSCSWSASPCDFTGFGPAIQGTPEPEPVSLANRRTRHSSVSKTGGSAPKADRSINVSKGEEKADSQARRSAAHIRTRATQNRAETPFIFSVPEKNVRVSHIVPPAAAQNFLPQLPRGPRGVARRGAARHMRLPLPAALRLDSKTPAQPLYWRRKYAPSRTHPIVALHSFHRV